jgi:hypothetical protein
MQLAPKNPNGGMKATKRCGEKALALDLDGGLDDDKTEGVVQAQKESEEFQRMQNKLVSCNRCSPNKWCKINKLGTHVHLTVPQLGSWAHALVCLSILYTLAI